ncbi:MAG TPA: AfsR/SARP family transcriptional regulator [Ilumatobacteraceae bacterium]|nr:AfsR/SARP family transcriptional regulator [Ilumatobacteraceae bacterium]
MSSVTEHHTPYGANGGPPAGARVMIRVLGTPQVSVDGAVVPLGGRSMLLLLRLATARLVAFSSARLREDVWGGDSTGTDGRVRVQVNRLRATLGSEVVVRRHDGYALGPNVGIDVDRFEILCGAGRDRSMSLEARVAAFDEALELWADGAYRGLDHVPWLQDESVRLQELAEQAIDDCFELRTLVQPPASIIADLRAAVLRRPTRERRVELLAMTLYRAGRQTDALAVIRQLREDLLDQFGLSPAAAVNDLELRILRQDPTLLDRPVAAGASGDGVSEGRLRSARALIKAGMIDEALAVTDDVAAAALAAGDRVMYAEALLVRARGLELSDHAVADPSLLIDEAQGIARQLRSGPLLARCAMARFGGGVPTDLARAIVELTEPLDLLPAASPDRVDLLCFAAVAVAFSGGSPAALPLLEAARRSHERSGSRRAKIVWLASQSIVGAVPGADAQQIDDWATQAFDIARELDDPALSVVAAQAVIRSKYSIGDLAAVDRLLPGLERDSYDAGLSFGVVRVSLCRATNALARGQLDVLPGLFEQTERHATRFRTQAGASALFAQRGLLRMELDDDELAAEIQPLLAGRPSAFHAVSAFCGRGDADGLMTICDDVPAGSSYSSFVAYASLVAARDDHAELGAWCAARLEELGDGTILIGFGTTVIGFAPHYAAMAYQAMGDHERARQAFARARDLSDRAGADLWCAYSSLGLAKASMADADPTARQETADLLAVVDRVARASGSVRLARMLRETLNGSSSG